MSWKEMLEVRDQHVFRLPEDPHPPKVTGFGVDEMEWIPEQRQTLYRMGLRIYHQFYANDAEYRRAREIAERAMTELLFHDVRSRLDRLRSAVYNRDYQEAFRLIDEMDTATKP